MADANVKSWTVFLQPDKLVDNEFTERFKNETLQGLIDAFNGDNESEGWVNARGRFQAALVQEFRKRGFELLENSRLDLDKKLKLSYDGKSLLRVDKLD